jgi:hypothetical protein
MDAASRDQGNAAERFLVGTNSKSFEISVPGSDNCRMYMQGFAVVSEGRGII